MRTSDLIEALAADAATPPARLGRTFAFAFALAVAGAALVFAVKLGPRPDFVDALGTVRFPFKFVVTGAFGAAAALLALRLARPGASVRSGVLALGLAVAVLGAGVLAELAVTPEATWAARLVGHNWLVCLINVPVLSAIPLSALLIALRRGAPASPSLAGAVAGVVAGAIGATFYAAQCPDDSPLFVAVWYTLAIAIVATVGAVVGSRLLRW
ncbi:hypothetical protein JOD31_003015 [Methylopila capsulata]|uniref:DUF1109 family protein n=1 Tax=Methylopila capsulata TaxID=61654 RepID=A0A9W6MT39_9HYPH|nr:NrsF family protein [Methylopila capsulata]MBM7852773.1 hypothetical protein [Methylopila capsulata]GLK56983.1 hypothetical protein GCM10008170_30020 [Methylopila capsulata]